MRPDTPPSAPPSPRERRLFAIEFGAAAMFAALTGAVSAHFELHERIHAFTRRYESLQLDEWLVAALALALGMCVVAWRRYRRATVEIEARLDSEARLREVLDQNRHLARQHLRALEDERKQLARDLHDELGQYLTALKIDLTSARSDEEAHLRSERSQRIVHTLDHVHRVVRDMIGRLRPAGLDDLGLTAAIESCIHQWQARSPDVSFSFHPTGEIDALSEPVGLAIYRIVQEALTNTFRHARARHVDVVLTVLAPRAAAPGEIILSVSDDGGGAATVSTGDAFGLRGIRERAELLGGSVSVDAAPGRGFTIEARLPA
jgi:signal transduction histidine kinase